MWWEKGSQETRSFVRCRSLDFLLKKGVFPTIFSPTFWHGNFSSHVVITRKSTNEKNRRRNSYYQINSTMLEPHEWWSRLTSSENLTKPLPTWFCLGGFIDLSKSIASRYHRPLISKLGHIAEVALSKINTTWRYCYLCLG